MVKRQPAKLRLTELQNRLLWMLNEAGAEDLGCVFNTLRPSSADELERELRPLLRLGWVSFYKDLGRKGMRFVELNDQEAELMSPLNEIMIYDEGDGHWRRTSEPNATIIEGLMLNNAARPALEQNRRRGEPD
jgi:hypothetical protein